MSEEKTWTEEIQTTGEELLAKVKELVREGNVRRVIIKDEEGKTLIEIPLTLGVVGAVLLPVWAAIGAIGGALAGGVLGLLKGGLLKGAILGAAGGAIAGKVVDLGVEDDFLKEVGEGLGPGSSAIVALVDFERIDAAMEELDKFEGGRILRHRLSGDVYRKLSDAVAD